MTMPPYESRTYRTRMARPGLVGFRVAVKETDLWVLAARNFSLEAVGRESEAHPALRIYE